MAVGHRLPHFDESCCLCSPLSAFQLARGAEPTGEACQEAVGSRWWQQTQVSLAFLHKIIAVAIRRTVSFLLAVIKKLFLFFIYVK